MRSLEEVPKSQAFCRDRERAADDLQPWVSNLEDDLTARASLHLLMRCLQACQETFFWICYCALITVLSAAPLRLTTIEA